VSDYPEPLRPVLAALEVAMSDGYGLRGATVGQVRARMVATKTLSAIRPQIDVGSALEDLTRAGVVERAPGSPQRGRARRWRAKT
jgi:hypothetical protein